MTLYLFGLLLHFAAFLLEEGDAEEFESVADCGYEVADRAGDLHFDSERLLHIGASSDHRQHVGVGVADDGGFFRCGDHGDLFAVEFIAGAEHTDGEAKLECGVAVFSRGQLTTDLVFETHVEIDLELALELLHGEIEVMGVDGEVFAPIKFYGLQVGSHRLLHGEGESTVFLDFAVLDALNPFGDLLHGKAFHHHAGEVEDGGFFLADCVDDFLVGEGPALKRALDCAFYAEVERGSVGEDVHTAADMIEFHVLRGFKDGG